MKLSVVIPVFNEQDSLRQLHEEIGQAAGRHGFEFETIFVDDGSTDGSWTAIEQIAGADNSVLGLRFRRNFGKSAALAAGIRRATCDWIVTLDSDLQDNIAELPKFIDKANAGFDLVTGWKIVRLDPIGKRLASKVFNWLVNRVSGLKLHDHNCGFKLLRRKMFDDLRLYGEWHRFIPVLAASRGWRVSEVEVDHRRRKFGKSKYGLSRFIQGSLDLITIGFLSSQNHRPQRFLGNLGLFASLIGLAGMLYLAVYWVLLRMVYLEGPPVHQRPLLYYSLGALLVGVHLLALGFLAELLVAERNDDRSHYSISQSTRDANSGKSRPGQQVNSINAPTDGEIIRIDGPPKIQATQQN